jgi:spore germination protein KC
MGIDKTANGYLITEQIINPKAVASKKATNQSPTVIYSIEGESIEGAINNLHIKTPRLIYQTHLRMVVFSEDIAKEGIKSILDYFMRSYEYRSDFYCVIAKGSPAKDVLSLLTPLESIPGVELFKLLELSAKETGLTNDIKLIGLINSITSEGTSPALNAVEIIRENINSVSTDAFKQSGSYDRLIYNGLGVLNSDKLVGWMTQEEGKGYNYIKNKIKASVEAVQCGKESEAVCNILSARSKVNADVNEGKPSVDISITLNYIVSSTRGNIDLTKINQALENKIKKLCKTSLEKAQKELQTDIFGFGDAVHRRDAGYWKSVKDKWSQEYVKMPVNISVKAEIKGIGEITKSLFTEEKG